MVYIAEASGHQTNFLWREFYCPCGKPSCTAIKVPPPDFLRRLQRARNAAGIPFAVSSWSRCQEHNDSLSGAAPNSWHVKALAVDIRCGHSAARFRIALALMIEGFSVRLYAGHIHADLRPGPPVLTMG